MPALENKELIRGFSHHFAKASTIDILTLMHSDVTWQVVGKTHLLSEVGSKSKYSIFEYLTKTFKDIGGGVKLEVQAIEDMGNLVATEFRSSRKSTGVSTDYCDHYILFAIRDGRISQIWEYSEYSHFIDAMRQRRFG